jgi:osmoprotectant transport system ATP-binding protein
MSAADRPPVIEFRGVSFAVNGKAILDNFNLQVREGETLVLLGRSGSGKTTALRLINRLQEPNAGEVIVSGRPTTAWGAIELRRGIGYVIQETGLFPHFTVERNVALVPRLENWPAERVRTRVNEVMRIAGLRDGQFESRYPHELSGGQRQRVGVARALAADPAILLMDEPFGALDPVTRVELQREFVRIQRQLRTTVLLVTHDMAEAFALADRIGVLDRGALVVCDSPDIVARSRDPRVRLLLETVSRPPETGGAS